MKHFHVFSEKSRAKIRSARWVLRLLAIQNRHHVPSIIMDKLTKESAQKMHLFFLSSVCGFSLGNMHNGTQCCAARYPHPWWASPPFLLNFNPSYQLHSIPGEGGSGEKKEIPIFLLLFSHLHRLMLKVCLRIVCNYACLHTKALLCVKVWKPFVAWGCEEKTAQTNFKQDQRHETRWQTGALWLQTWLLPHSNMLFGAASNISILWKIRQGTPIEFLENSKYIRCGFFFYAAP